MHSHNIVHMDIKPANILVKNKMPRISDFTLSFLLEYLDEEVMVEPGTYYQKIEAPEISV